MIASAIDEQNFLYRGVVTDLLVEFPEPEIAAHPEHREPRLLGPPVDGVVSPANHPLRVPEDDQRLRAERIQFVQNPLLNHGATDRVRASASLRAVDWGCSGNPLCYE